MEESKPDLYRQLEQPAAFPHRPEQVEHIQTHISHVYIAPPFVYKIKKPVDFGFLDYSTLEQRKHFCEREVALNRRLCDDVYLGVVPISKEEGRYVLEGKGRPVEYAVKMKQLEDRYFLYSYIENDSLTDQQLERVAEKIASFYLRQEPDNTIEQYANIDHIRYNTDENFRQTEQFVSDTIDKESYKAIQYFTERFIQENTALFERRIEEGRIVDGHGDLHLDHIHIRPNRICIYDCIEFNERFRCGDQALDLAFLAMDLDFHECQREERFFVQLMAEKLDDPDMLKLLDFYKCYRAYIKGKVKSLQSTEEEVEPKDRQSARDLASRYFELSLRYALLGSQPQALIFMGRVATGKSTLAEHLSDRLNIARYSSDRIRKSIAGLPIEDPSPASKRDKLYSASMSEKTYRTLIEQAGKHLQIDESVILDATFSNAPGRRKLIDKLKSEGTDYLFIEARAPDETIRSRLAKRKDEDDVVSDARPDDFETLNERYEPPEEIESDHLIRVNTDQSLPETIKTLYEQLIDRKL